MQPNSLSKHCLAFPCWCQLKTLEFKYKSDQYRFDIILGTSNAKITIDPHFVTIEGNYQLIFTMIKFHI